MGAPYRGPGGGGRAGPTAARILGYKPRARGRAGDSGHLGKRAGQAPPWARPLRGASRRSGPPAGGQSLLSLPPLILPFSVLPPAGHSTPHPCLSLGARTPSEGARGAGLPALVRGAGGRSGHRRGWNPRNWQAERSRSFRDVPPPRGERPAGSVEALRGGRGVKVP